MAKRTADGLPWPVPHEAMRFAGYRAMRAQAATRPDAPVGYGGLGMYLFSHAMWLIGEVQRGGFERVNFMARDGWMVKAAFDRVSAAIGLDVTTGYVRVSRQAVLPLHFREAEDWTRLPEWVDMTAHSPETLLGLLAPVLRDGDVRAAVSEAGFGWKQRLTEAEVPRFIDLLRERLWDEARAAAYREHARAYLAPLFAGKCATFDVGYNLRSESVIREVTGADVTAFITHTDSDVPDHRGVPYRTLYGQSPYVSWVAREQFLLENAPMCVGYDADGPVLAEQVESPCEAIRECQRQALAFVDDMVSRYGAALADMPFRPADGCAAFEHFLHRARRREMLSFRMALENGFHAGTAGEDSAFLQWRLMQTDFRSAVLGEPRAINRLRRLLIRVREEPRSVLEKLRRG